MAAIAAGVGVMVMCSSSLAAAMMMGGSEDDAAATTAATTTTPTTPTLPYITALNQDANALRHGLNRAILSLDPKDRETLQIFGLVDIKAEKYLYFPLPPTP